MLRLRKTQAGTPLKSRGWNQSYERRDRHENVFQRRRKRRGIISSPGHTALGQGRDLRVVWDAEISRYSRLRALCNSSAIVHLFRGYRYSASGEKRISSVL